MAFIETLALINLMWIGWTCVGLQAIRYLCGTNPPLRVILEHEREQDSLPGGSSSTAQTGGD